ncbi:rRNA maturation RNAse YbeY [candidate division WOR-3 bacterium]|nr:rRNA maturation RNAse YbeY [candidate division WOR-3 bacterium]
MHKRSSIQSRQKKQKRSVDQNPRRQSTRINIYHAAGRRLSARKDVIRQLIRKALRSEGKQLAAVNIIIADDSYLRGLNERFFRKKRRTNVISFDLDEVSEIYVSQDRARDAYDIYYYILHGLLHLAGYDHRNVTERTRMHQRCLEHLENE